ncbi:MAG: BCCT family transporter, partial [Haloferacaceae archaeon]
MAADEDTTGEMSDGLQVELFHPETDREPGDTNIQKFGFDVHPVVFPVALLIIAAFVVLTILGPRFGLNVSAAYTWLFNTIGDTFGWFYLLAVNVFIVVLLYFAFGKYGSIRIGGVQAEKEFSDFAWMAMLFSAGMGIGLMFF